MKFGNMIALVGFTQAARLAQPKASADVEAALAAVFGGAVPEGSSDDNQTVFLAGDGTAPRVESTVLAQVQDDGADILQLLQFDLLTAIEAMLDAANPTAGTDVAIPLSDIEAWLWANKEADIHAWVRTEFNEQVVAELDVDVIAGSDGATDAHISRGELEQAWHDYYGHGSRPGQDPESNQEYFRQLDADEDGLITLADLHRVSGATPVGENLANDVAKFTEADTTGDGFLDFDELLAAMRGS